jgi:hypothetical protein
VRTWCINLCFSLSIFSRIICRVLSRSWFLLWSKVCILRVFSKISTLISWFWMSRSFSVQVSLPYTAAGIASVSYVCNLACFWTLEGFRTWRCALMMEAVQTSETLVNSYQSTRRYNPEDSHLHSHCRENLKSSFMTLKMIPAICKTFDNLSNILLLFLRICNHTNMHDLSTFGQLLNSVLPHANLQTSCSSSHLIL